MKELRVDPQLMKAKAGEMDAKRTDIQNTMNNIKNEMDSLKTSFISDGATKAQFQFQTAQADVEAMLNVVAEYSSDLQQLAALYDKTQNDAITAANALPTDIFT